MINIRTVIDYADYSDIRLIIIITIESIWMLGIDIESIPPGIQSVSNWFKGVKFVIKFTWNGKVHSQQQRPTPERPPRSITLRPSSGLFCWPTYCPSATTQNVTFTLQAPYTVESLVHLQLIIFSWKNRICKTNTAFFLLMIFCWLRNNVNYIPKKSKLINYSQIGAHIWLASFPAVFLTS